MKVIHWLIKKYCSYFLSSDWVSSKGHPVLKAWEQLQDKHSKQACAVSE